jgi:membrane-associated PAP2 superfamily phosphatase
MDELLKAIGGIAGNTGLDIVLILVIVFGTYGLRLLFKPKSDNTSMLFALGIGLALGIGQIIIGKVSADLWLRTILGYPLTGMFAYMTYRKLFPDSNLLKPPEG